MTSKEHKKHAFVQKPMGGKFHRNEFAILGAPCSIIQQLSRRLSDELEKDHKLGYVDADHKASDYESSFRVKYTNKIDHNRLEFYSDDLTRDFKGIFNDQEAVLVNGNHFTAQKQIVIINEEKKESLSRKLDRLTNVLMILLDKGSSDVHDFMKEALPGYASLPTYKIDNTVAIANVLKTALASQKPLLNGLVLAGGRSVRMGQDKGAIDYYGKPQREHMADLLSSLCDQTFISKRSESSIKSEYGFIEDTFTGLGPYGGILSAFRKNPNTAWLIVACDVPMLDEPTLQCLINNRDVSKVATCFYNPETNFPEPLIAIWEPRAYQRLLYFLGLGYSCPRKVLINSDIHQVLLDRAQVLTNVNTPEEYNNIKNQIIG
ncbi:MAG: NTP transferase domain-containing protein [Bacteroidota bacterium]